MARRTGLALALCTLGAVAWVHRAVPLQAEVNDSAWYYMNAHWLLSGEYIHETRYPSFDEPIRYYALGGYSLVLLVTRWLAEVTGLGFAGLLSCFQLACHLASGVLLGALARRCGLRAGVIGVGLAYFAWFPFLNSSTLVMSESYGLCLLLLSLWLVAGSERHGPKVLAGCFVLGLASLARPPFLFAVPALLALALTPLPPGRRRRALAVAAILLALVLAPAADLAWSTRAYGGFALRPGTGWNLWNRVIAQDRLIPTRSARLDEVRRLVGGRKVPLGPWWDLTRQLSLAGLDARRTQEVCGAVALDGIREHPDRYLANTPRHMLRLGSSPLPVRVAFATYPEHRAHLEGWAGPVDHRPLATELLRGLDRFGDRETSLGLRLYAAWAIPFTHAGRTFHALALGLLGLATAWSLAMAVAGRGRRYRVRAALLAVPWLLLLAAALAEMVVPRYNLVAFPFSILAVAFLIEEIGSRQRSRTGEGIAPAAAPGPAPAAGPQ